ncbi:DUF2796 domain-containing protein [Marinobacter sp.]|uniref:ZrgA family zinc uptake protein n=1 Tax=Marinobacter sp. TaxID=50741 RepID=UPI0034A1BB1E
MNHTSNHGYPYLTAGLFLTSAILAGTAVASDNPGAHRHGHGQLQVAVEGGRVDLVFTSPAYNLAGFERDARTPEEEAQLEDLADWLGTQPLVDTDPASCTVVAAQVHHSGSANAEQHHDHGHDSDDHHDGEAENHREYEVSQQLECGELANGQNLNATIMGEYPDIEALSVQWVTETGQGSTRLEQDGNSGFSLND